MPDSKTSRLLSFVFYPIAVLYNYVRSFFEIKLDSYAPTNLAIIDITCSQGLSDMEPVYVPKEVKNPEKIYATLQETRDSCSFKKTEGSNNKYRYFYKILLAPSLIIITL